MHLISIRTTWFTQQRQWGLYQNKVTSSLGAIQRPGHWVDNCKMVYSGSNRARNFKSASRFALIRFWNYSRDYSLNCTPLGPITITNWTSLSPITIIITITIIIIIIIIIIYHYYYYWNVHGNFLFFKNCINSYLYLLC